MDTPSSRALEPNVVRYGPDGLVARRTHKLRPFGPAA